MAKNYKGSLTLDWYNKQKAIINLDEKSIKSETDIPAPRINWVNKEEALFYELSEEEGKGLRPYWVDRNDIRVKEARPLIFQIAFKAFQKTQKDSLLKKEWKVEEIHNEENAEDIENILIKGDNLLALNTLKKYFDKLSDNEKVKSICIDPPFNSGYAFEEYDDNLEHSEWLTLMRDRLQYLKELLSEDGSIFVILDDKESSYLKLLLDDVFGRDNYCNEIIVKTSSSYGFKSTSKDLLKQANHIFLYAKNKTNFHIKNVFTEKEYDTQYKYIFLNTDKNESEWSWMLVADYFAKEQNYSSAKEAKTSIGAKQFDNLLFDFILENATKIFRTAAVSGGAYKKRKDTIHLSKTKKKEIIRHPNDDLDYMFIGGERVIFYSERLTEIDGISLPGEIVTDIWNDIPIEGLAGEGNVDFPKGKKPEKLIQRMLELTTEPGDIVLDCFAGSGTTPAVANKMGRKWIAIEFGNQAERHIIPRLSSVIKSEDQTGISKSVNWQGGGSFKYYHLGESIIKIDEESKKGEFNWPLGAKFIQDSLLISYDFNLIEDVNLFPAQLFKVTSNQPTLGKIVGKSGKALYGIAYLAEPKDKNLTITNEVLKTILLSLKNQKDFQSLIIYTNKGIDIAEDSMPDELEIIKVPHAIFNELER
jgi:adenine-specific DNA-methyltransferase